MYIFCISSDHNKKNPSVDAQWQGNIHDTWIWRLSAIQDLVHGYDGDVCLLGVSG